MRQGKADNGIQNVIERDTLRQLKVPHIADPITIALMRKAQSVQNSCCAIGIRRLAGTLLVLLRDFRPLRRKLSNHVVHDHRIRALHI